MCTLKKFNVFKGLLAGGGLFMTSFVSAADYAAENKALDALAELTEAPAAMPVEGFENSADIKAIFYDTLDYKGKPTKSFAWIGIPQSVKTPMPGVVLVHGGGGTAFKEWVEKWNAKGYAAISIAVEGQTSVRSSKEEQPEYSFWKRHEHAGPHRTGIYNLQDKPIEEQWMYHAVADTILANSLLRAQPGVDKNKVGIMGVSWGGVITSTVIGLDDRFAFAIPTYGCGYLAVSENNYGRALGNNTIYKEVLDPILRLKNAQMPVLWYSWPRESHFRMESLSKCYNETSGAKAMSIVPGMNHGHGPAWNRAESYAFADSVIKEGEAWAEMKMARVQDGAAQVIFRSSKTIHAAKLIHTADEGIFSGDRNWIVSDTTFKQKDDKVMVSAELPEGTKSYFLNIESGDLILSSDYQEVK